MEKRLNNREHTEQQELSSLASYAMKAANSKGRVYPQPEHPLRTAFQRDRDRIVHSSAFRRMEFKTQVFLPHEGDHIRTRLTHSIEVAQVSRTMARCLGLNEDLTEAIALVHDLGHTPFGHAGEDVLQELLAEQGGFNHNRQSLRVVDILEHHYPDYPGLNLSYEVREGIVKHETKTVVLHPDFDRSERTTLEASLVDIADEIAYNAHDIDDGLRAGLISMDEVTELSIWYRSDIGEMRIGEGSADFNMSYDNTNAHISATGQLILEPTNGVSIEGNFLLPRADGSASDILKTDGSGNTSFVTPTVDIPISISMYDAEPARGSETNWNGGLLELDNAAAVNSGAPFVMSTKGSGKIVIVVNAGGDLAGDITLTGTSVDRNDGTQTASDTSVITINGTTTDNTTTDANSNVVHKFTKAYISDKWFTGVVTITTADVAITDMDIFHISFEQFNDQPTITLNTLDANIFTTNVNAEFDAYLFDIHVTGDECDIENHAELHVGAVGGAKAQTAQANKYFRLRQGNIGQALDGTTDGIWVDVHYSNSPSYIEDVTIKVWATCSQPLTLS